MGSEAASESESILDRKRKLRRAMIAKRDAIPAVERARGSALICTRLLGLPQLARAHTICVYCPFGSEVDVRPLVRQARAARLAAPVALGNRRMEFVEVDAEELLDPSKTPAFLRSPKRSSTESVLAERGIIAPSEIDFIVVPGLAFDEQGGRVGYGGGYYDSYLARPELHAFACAVAFDVQVLSGGALVPRESHDRTIDAVITPARTIRQA
jgi:5-formyltetrahydrofolate cyclo-ligase